MLRLLQTLVLACNLWCSMSKAATVLALGATSFPCQHSKGTPIETSPAPAELYQEVQPNPVQLVHSDLEHSSPGDSGTQDTNSTEVAANRTNALTETINKLLANYDRRIRPDFYGPPVQVGITLMVKGFSAVSEVDMEYKIDFYLRQFWKDPRLRFDLQPRVDVIGLTHEFSHQIWHPDTFFPNEKRSYIHSATVLNEFIRLNPDGQILKSTRLTLTATCPMDLQYFPMDQQICSVEIGSYGFSKSQIVYVWKEAEEHGPVRMGLNSVTLPQFNILGHREKAKISQTSTGNYTTLYCEFLFVRSLNYYLSQFYIPAALIVVISWFSLWMGRDAAAERMALGVTAVLTITTLLLSTNSNSPKISYIKAIDVYLGVCFALVFGSLLQSATIGYLSKRFKTQQMKRDRLEDRHFALKAGMKSGKDSEKDGDFSEEEIDDGDDVGRLSRSPTVIEMEYTVARQKVKQSKSMITMCDIISRIMFPLGFSLFNIFYWSYYLSVSKLHVDNSWQKT